MVDLSPLTTAGKREDGSSVHMSCGSTATTTKQQQWKIREAYQPGERAGVVEFITVDLSPLTTAGKGKDSSSVYMFLTWIKTTTATTTTKQQQWKIKGRLLIWWVSCRNFQQWICLPYPQQVRAKREALSIRIKTTTATTKQQQWKIREGYWPGERAGVVGVPHGGSLPLNHSRQETRWQLCPHVTHLVQNNSNNNNKTATVKDKGKATDLVREPVL